jgi:branched-chain amino acid transport system permease protein
MNKGIKWFLLVGLLGLPAFTNNYWQYVFNVGLIYIVLAIGLNLILGYCGQFAFAHAAFYGIGAYTCGLAVVKLAIPFWFALLIGGLFVGIVAAAISIPVQRLERFYLAIVTLTFAELAEWVFRHWESVTYGTSGFRVPPPELIGIVFASENRIYYIDLVVCVAMIWLARNVTRSHVGRAFVTIREQEGVALSQGINVTRYKIYAYFLSGVYAGIGGGMYVATVGFVDPGHFGLLQITMLFAMVMIGGLGRINGSIIGALLIVMLPEFLRNVQEYQEMAYGFLLLFCIIYMPRGIFGALEGILGRRLEDLHRFSKNAQKPNSEG